MTALLQRLLVPVASAADANATARALTAHEPGRVIAVHVIEKAGGGIDKASVEQRQEAGEAAFAAIREILGSDVETEIRYGTDVAEAIFDAGVEHDATAIAFTPRGGSRWVQLLTGDVALDLITNTDRPVIVLPEADDEE